MNNLDKLMTYLGESKTLKAELNAIGVDVPGLVNDIAVLKDRERIAEFTKLVLVKGSISPRFKYLDDEIKNIDDLVNWGIKQEAKK